MKIAIVDDHTIFRQGLRFVLSQIPEIELLFEAENGLEFIEKIKTQMPDITFMDISMPQMDGIEATEKALLLNPDIKIISLSSYGDEIYYYRMIKAGVMGFITKDAGKPEIEKALFSVHSGENYFPKAMLRNLVFKLSHESNSGFIDNELSISKREKEVLTLICQGYSNQEIANQLFISPKTVDNHRTNLLSKTNTRNSAHLVMYAIKNKIINPQNYK